MLISAVCGVLIKVLYNQPVPLSTSLDRNACSQETHRESGVQFFTSLSTNKAASIFVHLDAAFITQYVGSASSASTACHWDRVVLSLFDSRIGS